MTDKERENANKRQLHEYLSGLYPEWRLLYIRSIKKMFDNYDDFYSDIAVHSTLAGEKRPIKLGLTCAAVAETMQYIEDLFSLMYNTQEYPLSMNRILNYTPRKVIDYIMSFESKPISEQLVALHMGYFPDDCVWPNADVKELYTKLKDNTVEHMKKIIAFRNKHRRLYNQYKHSLKIPLKEFGNPVSVDPISTEVPLYSYESLDVSNEYFKDSEPDMLAIPNPHPEVMPFAEELYSAGELLRAHMVIVSLDNIMEVAYLTYQLFNCVCGNLMAIANSSENDETIAVWFPNDDPEAPFASMDTYIVKASESENHTQ